MSNRPAPRLFVDTPLAAQQTLALCPEQAHYLAHVMRLTTGDAVRVFNGHDGEWAAQVATQSKKALTLSVTNQTRAQKAEPDVWLCPAPIKKAHFDYMLEKATELGAAEFHPVLTARTQIREVNAERLHHLAIEAAEQSERLTVPALKAPVTLESFIAAWPEDRTLIVCAEYGEATPIHTALSRAPLPKAGILTGPEGGFTPEELENLRHVHNALFVRLGPRILRADTAALTALACWQSIWGDFR